MSRVSSVLAGVCVCSSLVVACAGNVPEDSACRNLTYAESGLTRDEYLPCAGEMIAGLDRLASQAEATLRGGASARSDGETTLREVRALFQSAGGRRLLERWNDRALTDLSVDISNTLTHYEAFYMVRILEDPHPFAAKSREAAEAELNGATRQFEEARRLYRRLR